MAKKDTDRGPESGRPKQRRDILKLVPRIILGFLCVALGILFLIDSDLISSFLFYVSVYLFGVFFFLPGTLLIVSGIYILFRTFKPVAKGMQLESKRNLVLDVCSALVALFAVGVLCSSHLPQSIVALETGKELSLNVTDFLDYYRECMLHMAPVGLDISLPARIGEVGGGFLSTLVVAIGHSIGLGALGTVILFSIICAFFVLVLLRHAIKALTNTICYVISQIRTSRAQAPNLKAESPFRRKVPEAKETRDTPVSSSNDMPHPEAERMESSRGNAFFKQAVTVNIDSANGSDTSPASESQAAGQVRPAPRDEASKPTEKIVDSSIFSEADISSIQSDVDSDSLRVRNDDQPVEPSLADLYADSDEKGSEASTSSQGEEPSASSVSTSSQPDEVRDAEVEETDIEKPYSLSTHSEDEDTDIATEKAQGLSAVTADHVDSADPVVAAEYDGDAALSRADLDEAPRVDEAVSEREEPDSRAEVVSEYQPQPTISAEELKIQKEEADRALDEALAHSSQAHSFHPAPVEDEELKEEEASQAVEEAAPQAIVPEKETPVEAGSDTYALPSISLLKDVDNTAIEERINSEAGEKLLKLRRFLVEFDIPAICDGYDVGPSVIRYHIRWKDGEKQTNLNRNILDNLSRKMGGISNIRFLPVIENCEFSAIEIPNSERLTFPFKAAYLEMAKVDRQFEKPTLFPLGEAPDGKIEVVELAKMPHLLVAGSTNSGKTAFIHSLLISLIMRNYPTDLKLVLIDPKKVEFSKYEGIPHLYCPIVTETDKAVITLKLLAEEMDRRYEIFRGLRVSDLSEYREVAKRRTRLERLPIIVVVIDEFADLMLSDSSVSEYVNRIAAKARACGIHLVLATQRPSVDVIDGKIKANIAARVALAVDSGVNSRVILDEGGAEELLGRGDMLAKIPGRKGLSRYQAAYISSGEIMDICDYLRAHGQPIYNPKFTEIYESPVAPRKETPLDICRRDSRYQEVKDFVMRRKAPYANSIKRQFLVGQDQAVLYLEAMEEEGLIVKDQDGNRRIASRAEETNG